MDKADTSLDNDLLSTLSPEERAAIADADPDEIAALKNVAGADAVDEPDDDKDDDGGEDADAVDAPAKAAGAAEPTPAKTAEAAAPAELAPAAAQAPSFAAQAQPTPMAFAYELPADFDERLAANSAATSALFERLKTGEITIEDLQAEQKALNDEQRQLDSMRIQRDISIQSQQQLMQAQRQMAVARLFDAAKEPSAGGIDYRADPAKARDLDQFVRLLAGDPAHEDKPLDWFLTEGHRRVRVLHGDAAAAPTVAPAKAAAVDPVKAKADAVARRRQDMNDLPKSLSQVPGGDGPGDVGGEFDDIMQLEGEAFERAIEGLAKTNPARYAKFQTQQQ